MAHRLQEKERRRQERLERERAEKAKVARRKRLQLALGALGAVAAIAVVVLLVSGSLGGDDAGAGDASAPEAADVTLPEQEIGDLREAVRAAGGRLRNPDIEGATHEPNKEFQASDYRTNPPTSGNHAPDWYDDGVYEPGTTPELGKLVHTLEHGRINVQYKPGTPAETVRQLEALLAEQSDGYHMLLYENTTGMDAAVAATTWGHSVTFDEMNPQVFDAIRTFRAEYIDQGPENVP